MGMPEEPLFRSEFHKVRKILRAVFARSVLWVHNCIIILATVKYLQDSRYYGFYAISGLLFTLELIFIIYLKHGLEMNRFCTAFLCYFLASVPPLWILEMTVASNITMGADTGAADWEPQADGNATVSETSNIAAVFADVSVTSLLEQSMMFLIIVCRWLLPRGRIDRQSLSQLLINYSAISADMLDFSEIFREPKVLEHPTFHYCVLGAWTVSLIQFIFVTTSSGSTTSARPLSIHPAERRKQISSAEKSEAVSISLVFFFQDGPFLIARLYAIFKLNVSDYLIMFFSLKNVLTLILGMYRLLVLFECIGKEGNDLFTMEEIAKSKESLNDMTDDRKKRKQKPRKK